MNKIIKKITLLSFALILFQACEDDETSNINIVPLDPINIAVTVNENDVIIKESEIGYSQDYTITATIEKAQEVDLALILTQTAGSATYGDDFSFDEEAIIISAGEITSVLKKEQEIKLKNIKQRKNIFLKNFIFFNYFQMVI